MRYREITIGLTPGQYAYLRDEARARTTSIAQLIRELLQEQLPAWVTAIDDAREPDGCTCGAADPQSARYRHGHLAWCGGA